MGLLGVPELVIQAARPDGFQTKAAEVGEGCELWVVMGQAGWLQSFPEEF